MKNQTLKKYICTFITLLFVVSVTPFISTLATAATTTKTSTITNKSTTKTANTNNQNPRSRNGQTNIKPILDKLVKAKTITAAQEAKIIAYQNKKNAAQQAEMAKIRKMTDAQRKAYFEKQKVQNKNQTARQNQFTDLVKNKTITQKQADAIEKVISASRPAPGSGPKNGTPPNTSTKKQ